MKILVSALLILVMTIAMFVPIVIGASSGFNASQEELAQAGNGSGETVKVELTLSETDITVSKGQTKTISATTEQKLDSCIFQWESADKNIATVTKSAESSLSAVITAIEAGTTTVTLNVIDKSQFKIIESFSCNVKVENTSIEFTQNGEDVSEVIISLDKSNSATVAATSPDENAGITWSSEDESIATVDDGVITAHKAGQVYIVAKSGKYESKLLVKIYGSVISIDNPTLVAVGSTAEVAVSGTIGAGATWTVDDSSIASVDNNGVVTGKKIGMTTVTITQADGQTATGIIIVKNGTADATELKSGKKAAAAADPGNWYFLCESTQVTIGDNPTLDNGVIKAHITNVGTSGTNFFYLRYQLDDVGDVTYKQTLYIYSDTDNAYLQINGKDTYLSKGLNRIDGEYTSPAPKDGNPYQIKFRSAGKYYIIPIFEEISRVEKMTLSESTYVLNTSDKTSFTLTATVPGQPNPTVVWTSSNESAVTVNNGVVTAVGEGAAVITATCGNLSATCFVLVEGDAVVEGTELTSGNKAATTASPGKWFYLADGGSKLHNTPVMDSDGNIHMTITSVDTAAKKYVYLRYQPATAGVEYKVTVVVNYSGVNGSAVDFTGGNVTSAVSKTLNNGTNTLEFEFTSNGSNPLQLKLYAVGSYVVNVTFSEI